MFAESLLSTASAGNRKLAQVANLIKERRQIMGILRWSVSEGSSH
jgi:hypothetical protein